MPHLTLNNAPLTYVTEGDGFPLILVPDHRGAIADWAQHIPLLGELCKVIAYEYSESDSTAKTPASQIINTLVVDLAALLDTLAIERTYLAGYARGGMAALHFALRHPGRVEGLLLLGIDDSPPHAPLHAVAVPTCVFVGSDATAQLACATLLTTQLPRCAKRILPGVHTALHGEQPLPLGHAMMDFLLQCERQRNLVRGASFLL